MGVLFFIKNYFIWHYSTALKEGLIIWKNFIWFLSHFFSLKPLLRTLISPWRRIKEYRSRGFDPKQYFEIFVVNSIMRLVGFVMRALIILIGLAAEAAVIAIGILAIIIWLALPFFVILCFSRGIMIFL